MGLLTVSEPVYNLANWGLRRNPERIFECGVGPVFLPSFDTLILIIPI